MWVKQIKKSQDNKNMNKKKKEKISNYFTLTV